MHTEEIGKPMYPTDWRVEERGVYRTVTHYFVVARKLSIWDVEFVNRNGNTCSMEYRFKTRPAAEAALNKFLKKSSNAK